MPQCTDRDCGDDGCGGTCGTCEAGEVCNPQQQCETIAPPQVLQVQNGVRTGMEDQPWGGVMNSAGDKVCWPDITLTGPTDASLLYSNGEPGGDRVDISFGGQTVGSLIFETCIDGGPWSGNCGTVEGSFTASGTSELCLEGVGTGFIAALNALTLTSGGVCTPDCANRQCGDDGCSGSCGVCGPNERCALGMCVPNPPPGSTCTASDDSPYVPAGYSCVWNDEFGGTFGGGQARSSIDTTWWTFQNLDVNGEAQNYTNRECTDPDHGSNWNYCVENGALTILARDDGIDCSDGPDADNQPDNPDCALDWAQARGSSAYTSGRVITKHTAAYQYGYIEFRARLPQYTLSTPQSGLWPAIWLLGNNINEGPPPGDTPWPGCGEFDIMEWKSPDNTMGWNALWSGEGPASPDACSGFPNGGSTQCGPCCTGNECTADTCRGVFQASGGRWRWDGWANFPHTVFHTYGFLWTAQSMRVFIDGSLMGVFFLGPNETEFQQQMFIIMNLAVGGSLGGAIQVTDWSTATLDVDYIRWYQADGS